jgi:PTS system nitrogen regulatory IIA component
LRWIDEGALPAYRLDDQYRFHRAELLEWATTHNISPAAELFREAQSAPEGSAVLSEALGAGGISYQVPGADKESALRAAVQGLELPAGTDREFLLQMLVAREAMGSTGVGNGIAIPHVRSPIVLHGVPPTMSLCFLETPVPFDAPDGQPVHTLFTLMTPTVRLHLQMLSKLAAALSDPGFRAAVARRGPREEILGELRRAELGGTVASDAAEPGKR